MVVLRSTTLWVAVSSFTSSWRLTVISIAAPCAAGFSTSVSTIGMIPTSSIADFGQVKPAISANRGSPIVSPPPGLSLQHTQSPSETAGVSASDCIHLRNHPSVENAS